MKVTANWLLIPLLIIALVAVAYFWGSIRQTGVRVSLGPNAPVLPTGSPLSLPALPFSLDAFKKDGAISTSAAPVQVVADNLDAPWEVVFLPDNSLLITQRDGSLLTIHPDKTRFIIEIPDQITQVSESGLLGLAIHPAFTQNQLIYLYFTTGQGNILHNQVIRYRLVNHALTNPTVILDSIPAGNFHDGGRIKFGPDNFLYVATGDAGDENAAQDRNSLAGKILRIGDGGGLPADNPFPNSPVYSLGHRNVQGLAWDSAGNLWATEHGRSGVQSGLDELNLIKPGQNYGWPNLEGDEKQAGFTAPIIHSGASETWAPSGIAFLPATSPASVGEADSPGMGAGSLFFAGLRGETLYEAKINGESVTELKRHSAGEFGRLRDVVVGPDSMLYILTNNTDGRGSPKEGDDKLIRIDPANLP